MGIQMKQTNLSARRLATARQIAGHAQEDHMLESDVRHQASTSTRPLFSSVNLAPSAGSPVGERTPHAGAERRLTGFDRQMKEFKLRDQSYGHRKSGYEYASQCCHCQQHPRKITVNAPSEQVFPPRAVSAG
jgi:hypothetical protein